MQQFKIALECHPRPKYMTDRLKEMKGRMERIIKYMLKDVPVKKKTGYIKTLEEIIEKIQAISPDNICVSVTGDKPGLIKERDLIKKMTWQVDPNTSSNSGEANETSTSPPASIFTITIRGQASLSELQERLKEASAVPHPIYVIEAVDTDLVATEVKRILESGEDKRIPKSGKIKRMHSMDEKDARYFIVHTRPLSSSEPAEKMAASGDSEHPSTRRVTRASVEATRRSEATQLRRKVPSAPDQSQNMSRLNISLDESSTEVSPTNSPFSSPVGSPSRPDRTRHLSGSRKGQPPLTRLRVRQLSQSDSDDHTNVDNASAASTADADVDMVRVIPARVDEDRDIAKVNRSWGAGGDIAAAITNQIENNLFDVFKEILKLAKAIRKALPTKKEEKKTDSVLDRFIFEVESLMALTKTKRGQLKQKQYKERVEIFRKLQKDILGVNHVAGCCTIFGTLHVHTKPDDNEQRATEMSDNVRQEIRKLLLNSEYRQLGFEHFEVKECNWFHCRRTVRVVH